MGIFNAVDIMNARNARYRQEAKHKQEIEENNSRNSMARVALASRNSELEKEKAEALNTIKNDIEVIYKLFIHRNIFEVTTKTFLEKADPETKKLFLDIFNEVKTKRETDSEYKNNWWKYLNRENISGQLLWEEKNPDEIKYISYILLPDPSLPLKK